MSRRNKPVHREIVPDVRYGNVQVANFINYVMRNGKRSVATRLVYDALDLVEERTKRSGLEVFEQAMKNVAPRRRNLPDPDGSAHLSAFCSGDPLDPAGLPRPFRKELFRKACRRDPGRFQ